jgi:hypothetical protein
MIMKPNTNISLPGGLTQSRNAKQRLGVCLSSMAPKGLIVWQAMLSIDDLDKVFGTFKGMLTNYLLMVINETPEAKERFGCAGKIKARITHSDLTLETKGIDPERC